MQLKVMQATPIHHPHPKHLWKGICLMLLCFLCFTSMFALSRSTSQLVSIPMILLFQGVFSLLLMIPWWINHRKKGLKTERLGLIFLRSACGFAAYGLLFFAIQKISLVNAMLLNNCAPLMLPFVIWIALKIKISPQLWPGIFLGFLGIILILKPTSAIFDYASMMALGAALSIAISMLILRLLSHTEQWQTILFYFFVFSVILALPLAIIFWTPLSCGATLQLMALGLLNFVGQYAWAKAYHYGKASHLAPFAYSAVVYAAIYEWLLGGKIPDLWTLGGIILVCGGGILTIIFSKPLGKT